MRTKLSGGLYLLSLITLVIAAPALFAQHAALDREAGAVSPPQAAREVVTGDETFDFPRISPNPVRPRAGSLKPVTNSPCGGCYCHTQCKTWPDPDVCEGAPASHCGPFGSMEPCACAPCVCW